MRDGKADPYNHFSLTGEEIMERLISSEMVLIPVAIIPYGSWEPMINKFLFGTICFEPYRFPAARPDASRMYKHAMYHPCPVGVIPLATATWKKKKIQKSIFLWLFICMPHPTGIYIATYGVGNI